VKVRTGRYADALEARFEADDGIVGLARIRVDALSGMNGLQAFDCIMHEVSGVLRSIENRRARRPMIGDRVVVKGDPLERMVMTINRNEPDPIVGLLAHDGRPGTAQEPEPVRWSQCRYVDEAN
jgi:hypothetical protein